jgi:hypothetical protein
VYGQAEERADGLDVRNKINSFAVMNMNKMLNLERYYQE